ncbi:helix-turn-helix transcriptional regulator [uncultured Paludibaculum sp.]|uniref:helix-turn-helix domain-containing protein n=1 Tax=uncultured Paludibaculum sp. TaxID=1765020 RepID=UPI002AAAAF47|nr:helix-turn-helix transcriptional regulator [uncultured Paludibaculum sp.]
MAIRISLDRVLLKRGITLTDLAGRVGITLANMSVLKTNKARAIRFSTLDALCRELDCQPGDLMEWVSGEHEEPYIHELEERR